MKIVIIGGGAAAHEAAVAARNTNADAEIIICSGEKLRPYRRPALSGLLKAGTAADEKTFFIKPGSFYADNRIE
jgi:NADPH-dependent 2,4-dienoyl-CoA reductase/sulfur reductase-like enzyme